MVINILGINININSKTIRALVLLAIGFSVGISTYRFLLSFDNLPLITKTKQTEADFRAIDLVNSSELPMYLTDKDFKIIHCNDAFSKFHGMEKQNILNRPVIDIARECLPYVAKDEREKFIEEQTKLYALLKTRNLPSADATYRFDMRNHPNAKYRHYYEVNIHVDRLISKEVSIFGLFLLKTKV